MASFACTPAPTHAKTRTVDTLTDARRALVCGQRPAREVRRQRRASSFAVLAATDRRLAQTSGLGQQIKDGVLQAIVSGVLGFEPLASVLKKQARKTITQRAEKMGLEWTKQVKALKAENLEGYLERVENKALQYPEYYFADFHTYPRGNMSWEAATEVEVSAVAVHASIFPDQPMELGDRMLRQSYSDRLRELVKREPRRVLDVGCSTGLSTIALEELYPQAAVTGIDLSPYMLAVARLRADQRAARSEFVHAAGEATGLPEAAFDLASICLVTHELPQGPTRQILREMYRVLAPGGYLGIMDQDPHSEVFRRMAPAMKTLFASTEPYLDEYRSLDIQAAIREAGFEPPVTASNTPRHRVIVARKPE